MKLLRTLLPLLTLSSVLHAGPDLSKTPSPVTPAQPDGWSFRFAPYVWLTALEGDVTLGPLTAPVDISISDTLDSLDMGYMGVLEATYGRWSFGVDLVYGKTSQDIDARGLLFRSFRYEQKQWIVTPVVAYRVVDTAGYHMDLFAGARITALDAELTGRFVGGGELVAERDKAWVDPIVGIRGQVQIADRFFFRYNGDIGGFGASSDLNWQAFAGVGMNFTSNISGALGYRAIGIDYSEDRFGMDTVSHGPVLGIEFRW